MLLNKTTDKENENRPKQLRADTRQWHSGRVKFAVIGWEGKPEKKELIN